MINSVKEIFEYVSQKYELPIELSLDIAYYKISDGNAEFVEGNQNTNLEKIITQMVSSSTFGFYCDTSELKEESNFFSALGLTDSFIPYNSEEENSFKEMIILHELVHLIEMQNLKDKCKIELNECNKTLGDKIEKEIKKWDDDITHNAEFAGILHYLLQKHHPDNVSHLMRLAMSKTLIGIEDAIENGEYDEDYYDCPDQKATVDNKMSESYENIISIAELKSCHFVVEEYQRGYKWGVLQIHELLSDILTFEKDFESFYCLQPVVIKHLEGNSFELIDGQQRLTTIYIILQSLKEKCYSITYKTRESSEEFLNKITNLNVEKLSGLNTEIRDIEKVIIPQLNIHWETYIKDNPDKDNVDNYHFYCAYQYINNWVSENVTEIKGFKTKLLEDTRVIWYEQTVVSKAENTFIKFNRGKIDLAQAELIKALFVLQINAEKNIALKSFRLNQFAEEWNAIENQLQDNSFWFFISNDISDSRKSNRIDFLFDLIKEKPNKSNDILYSYHYYLSDYTKHEENRKHPLLNWEEVRDLFHQLFEWYNDRELYHLIGFMVYENVKEIPAIKEIYDKSTSKKNFELEIKKELKNYFFEGKNKERFDLEAIVYGKRSGEITSLLVLHNVINYQFTDNYYRFPFDRLKLENGWSLEHIHAQNTKGFKQIEDITNWIEDIKELVQDFKRQKEGKITISSLDELENSLLSQENLTPSIKHLVKKVDEEITAYFQKDSISNLCLLDRRTNSSIGNKFFSKKREEILEIDKMTLAEYNKKYKKEEKEKPYIPLATKHVFLKYFTNTGNVQMSFWGAEDRRDYLAHIENSIDKYLKIK